MRILKKLNPFWTAFAVHLFAICLTFLAGSFAHANLCEEVFIKDQGLPAGYRLSPEQFQTALELPNTRTQALALKEVATELKNIDQKKMKLLADSGLSAPEDSAKVFPEAFLRSTLQGKPVHQTRLRNAFEYLANLYPHLSAEAIGIMAFAVHNLPQRHEKLIPAYKIAKKSKIIERFVLKRNGTSDFVSFRDLIQNNLEIFIYVAAEFRSNHNLMHGNKSNRDFKGELRGLLRADMTLEEKLKIVTQTAEPKLTASYINSYNYSLNDKTGYSEIFFLDLLTTELLKRTKTRNIQDSDTQAYLHSLLVDLTKAPGSKEHRFIADLIDAMFIIVDQSVTLTPTQLKQMMDDNLASLGIDIRTKVKEFERLQAEEAERNRQPVVYQEVASTSKGVKTASIPGRLLRKAEKERPQEIKKPEVVEIPEDSTIDFLTLIEKNLDEVQTDTRYYVRGSQNEIQYIALWPSLIKELKRIHGRLDPYINSFSKGMINGGNENVKRLHSHDGHFLYEVKIGGTGDRIIVERDKETKTWIWRDIVDHDSVDEYMYNNGLK